MLHTLLNAVAVPEAGANADADALIARIAMIATDLASQPPEHVVINWDRELDAGRGPCLALGAERRTRPR